MDYSFLIGVHQVDVLADSAGVRKKHASAFSNYFSLLRIVQLHM